MRRFFTLQKAAHRRNIYQSFPRNFFTASMYSSDFISVAVCPPLMRIVSGSVIMLISSSCISRLKTLLSSGSMSSTFPARYARSSAVQGFRFIISAGRLVNARECQLRLCFIKTVVGYADHTECVLQKRNCLGKHRPMTAGSGQQHDDRCIFIAVIIEFH